jgi:hypothetical protein
MPLKKDTAGGGTETNGSKSVKYCSYCYAGGTFTRPDFTAEQMQQLAKEKLKEMGTPGIVSWFFTLGIPRLERWKK